MKVGASSSFEMTEHQDRDVQDKFRAAEIARLPVKIDSRPELAPSHPSSIAPASIEDCLNSREKLSN